jgi:cold shock CspA family protein
MRTGLMRTGKVKWFDATKGEVVQRHQGVRLHRRRRRWTGRLRAHLGCGAFGLPTLAEGQIVEYQTEVQKNGKSAATKLKLV